MTRMRSIFLEGIETRELALKALDAEFPDGGASGATVLSPDGRETVGWLYVGEPDDPDDQQGPFLIQADYSGRFLDYDAKEIVRSALLRVQARAGGEIKDYGD